MNSEWRIVNKKNLFLFAAVVLIVFAAITLLKSRSASTDRRDGAIDQTSSEQEEARQFWALYRQATAHRVAGRFDDAASAYRKALALNDRHEDALYYLGNMHLERGAFAEARTAWQRLTRLNPNSARAHAQLGDLAFCRYRDDGFDLDAAEAAFTRALEINSEETGPLLRLGQVALVRGDRTQAQYYFGAVIGSNYKSVEAYLLNGYLAWTQGDATEAAGHLAQAGRAARSEAPPQGVLGEGDTKPGAALMPSDVAGCRLFVPFIEAAVGMHENDPRADSLYQALDALLERIRHHLP